MRFNNNPHYWGAEHAQETNAEVMTGLREVIERVHNSDEQACDLAQKQWQQYHDKLGEFAMEAPQRQARAKDLVPYYQWWRTWGSSVPRSCNVWRSEFLPSQHHRVRSSASTPRLAGSRTSSATGYQTHENHQRLIYVHHNLRAIDAIKEFEPEDAPIVWD
eukprot:jgi/Mesvir1/17379/Mv26480-RA.1